MGNNGDPYRRADNMPRVIYTSNPITVDYERYYEEACYFPPYITHPQYKNKSWKQLIQSPNIYVFTEQVRFNDLFALIRKTRNDKPLFIFENIPRIGTDRVWSLLRRAAKDYVDPNNNFKYTNSPSIDSQGRKVYWKVHGGYTSSGLSMGFLTSYICWVVNSEGYRYSKFARENIREYYRDRIYLDKNETVERLCY